MEKILLNGAAINGIKSTKIEANNSKEYETLVGEANKRIVDNQNKQLEIYINASKYIVS